VVVRDRRHFFRQVASDYFALVNLALAVIVF
jgi:hypothetical protein